MTHISSTDTPTTTTKNGNQRSKESLCWDEECLLTWLVDYRFNFPCSAQNLFTMFSTSQNIRWGHAVTQTLWTCFCGSLLRPHLWLKGFFVYWQPSSVAHHTQRQQTTELPVTSLLAGMIRENCAEADLGRKIKSPHSHRSHDCCFIHWLFWGSTHAGWSFRLHRAKYSKWDHFVTWSIQMWNASRLQWEWELPAL